MRGRGSRGGEWGDGERVGGEGERVRFGCVILSIGSLSVEQASGSMA